MRMTDMNDNDMVVPNHPYYLHANSNLKGTSLDSAWKVFQLWYATTSIYEPYECSYSSNSDDSASNHSGNEDGSIEEYY